GALSSSVPAPEFYKRRLWRADESIVQCAWGAAVSRRARFQATFLHKSIMPDVDARVEDEVLQEARQHGGGVENPGGDNAPGGSVKNPAGDNAAGGDGKLPKVPEIESALAELRFYVTGVERAVLKK
ncbi:hypothetical protein DC007_14580, partial [Enterococcus faecalis]